MKRWIGVAAVAFGALLVGSVPETGAHGADAPAFVGAANCKKCHFKEYKSWAKTPMAKGYDTLKAGEKADAKKKAGLDPAKDYTKDESCLKCHTTGYGEPDGYPKAGGALASEREGIQCEVCHGPGSLYSPYMRDHEKDYKTDEAKKLGLLISDGTSCTACHHGGAGGSPTMAADEKFDGAAKLKARAGVHEHFKKTP